MENLIDDKKLTNDNNCNEIKYKYRCEICDINCNWKSEIEKHNNTKRHLENKKYGKRERNQCVCGKKYEHRSNLCLHKKSCSILNIKPIHQKDVKNIDFVSELLDNPDSITSIVEKEIDNIINPSNKEKKYINYVKLMLEYNKNVMSMLIKSKVEDKNNNEKNSENKEESKEKICPPIKDSNIYELEKAINESKILLNKNRNIINLISEKYNLKKLEETDFD